MVSVWVCMSVCVLLHWTISNNSVQNVIGGVSGITAMTGRLSVCLCWCVKVQVHTGLCLPSPGTWLPRLCAMLASVCVCVCLCVCLCVCIYVCVCVCTCPLVLIFPNPIPWKFPLTCSLIYTSALEIIRAHTQTHKHTHKGEGSVV